MSRLFSLVPVPHVLLLVIAASLTCTSPSCAQTPPTDLSTATNTGTNPYETYGGAHENINFGTGNLSIPITLLKLPGRNGHDLVLQITFDSKVWQLHGQMDSNSGQWTYDWEKDGGWSSLLPTFSFSSVSGPGGSSCTGGYMIALPDGSKQSFSNVRNQCVKGNNPYPAGNNLVEDSTGVSYTRLSVPGTTSGVGTVVMKDGSKLAFNGFNVTAEDSDGNVIAFSPGSITDSAGRVVTFNGVPPFPSNYLPTSIQYKDSNGQTQTITFNYSNFSIAPTFSNPVTNASQSVATPFPNCSPSNPCTWSLISSIVLPNGLSWTFQYDAWGEITKITYPTGGYTRCDYGVFTGTSWALPTPQDFREVVAKHVCTSYTGTCSTEDTTTYAPTMNGQNNQYMDVTDPLGNLTHYEFSEGGTKHFSTREINRSIYQGATTLLKTIHTDFNNLDSFGATQDISLPIRVTTTLNDSNQVTKTESDYDSYGSVGPVNPTIDNVTEQREFDYGIGATGSLIRKTDNTWLKTNPINSVDYTQTAIHILDRKSGAIVYNGAGTQVAKTLFEYDSYTAGISASGATQHDSSFGTSYTTRGNTTAIQRWRNTDGALLTTRNQFDDAGNILSTTDPLGNATSFSYTDNFTDGVNHSAKAYLAQITHPATGSVSHIERAQYFYNSGLTAATCGQNFPSGSSCANTYSPPQPDFTTYSYDLMNRRTQINLADGGQATTCFSEVSGSSCYSALLPVSIVSTRKATSTLSISSKVVVDGLARSIQTQLTSDPQGTDYTDKTYDSLGRVSIVSNAYRSTGDPTYGVTTTQYDALSRVTKLIPPDGSTSANNITTAYSGNCTTATDQAGKSRKSCSDALSRLTQVFEDPAGLNYETDYTYDVLNNLLTVNQKGNDPNSANWRTRTFTYDSLSQLLTANNPESGTITYTYDANRNLATKTSQAPNQTGTATVTATFSHDALNRLTQKSFNDGSTPTIKYVYDGASAPSGCTLPVLTYTNQVGRRTGMCDAAGSEAWAYDPIGRTTSDNRITGNIAKLATYSYNLDGSLLTFSIPSDAGGDAFTYTYQQGGAGRPLSMSGNPNVVNAYYSPAGALCNMEGDWNGRWITTTTFNNRLQPLETQTDVVYAGTPPQPVCGIGPISGGNATTKLDLSYSFVDSSSHNNGNVASITNNLVTNRSQPFTYDSLNRISTAQTTSTHATDAADCWAETYHYDPWGNLLKLGADTVNQSAYIGCTQESGFDFTNLTSTKNQISTSGYAYDAAGNMTTTPGPGALVYDAENHLLSAGGVSYTYDGATYTLDNAGNRTAKTDQRTAVATSYGYDNIYQLLSASQGATTTENYTYDPVGNRLSDLTTSGWSNNTSNELSSRPGVSYTFDNNGNTLTKTDSTGTTNYSWDFENRMTSVTLPGSGGTVSFKYDPWGRRIYKSSSSSTSIFAYDINNLIEEVNSGGAVVALYTQGEDVDEALAMLRSGATSFYEVDGLDSVTSLSNSPGALAQTYTFDSFGNQTASSGSLANPFRNTGRELDTETGLYFYRARYFDSSIGRFLSEDPIHNYLYKSFYSYVFNSAVNATDPTGKRTRVCCRPVGNWVAGSALGKYHCSIAIDGNPGINRGGLGTFSLFPANYSTLSDTGIGVPHSNDPTDVGPIQNGTASCKDVPDCTPCKEQKILENQGYGGDPGPAYNYHTTFRGRVNSNTYVSYALKKAGCTPPKLDVSAPGY